MKFQDAVTIALLVSAGVVAIKIFPTFEQQKHIKQLLATRECRGCNLTQVSLKGMDLQGVNLEGANLVGADLQGSKLGNANLKGANLTGANLQGSDLGCMGISLNLNATDKETTLDFNVGSTAQASNLGSAKAGLSLKADDRGASMNLHLFGCANLEGATLTTTRMPDGQIHP